MPSVSSRRKSVRSSNDFRQKCDNTQGRLIQPLAFDVLRFSLSRYASRASVSVVILIPRFLYRLRIPSKSSFALYFWTAKAVPTGKDILLFVFRPFCVSKVVCFMVELNNLLALFYLSVKLGIKDNLLKSGASEVEFTVPNKFTVSYDSTKITKQQILDLKIFSQYPATEIFSYSI